MKKKLTGIVGLLLLLTLAFTTVFTVVPDEVHAAEEIPALHVEGTKLYDEDGDVVQLKGISTHGINWFPEYVNKKAFKSLKKWGANTIRLANYTMEYNGYCTVDAAGQKKLRSTIYKGVDYATDLGMYVIIDWHILSDCDPKTNQKTAKKFFKTMAKKYSDHTNVIYEICNEPNGGATWKNNIKPYAKSIIKTIRKYDDDAVIIVGTGNWSQDVDAVIGSKLKDDNVMYALHFYAATHKDWLIDKAKKAIKKGVPIFISECNITEASGNGGVDRTSGKAWMKFINKYDVPYVVWNLSNKGETSALIKSSCSKKSGWKTSDLTDSGKWWKKQMGE